MRTTYQLKEGYYYSLTIESWLFFFFFLVYTVSFFNNVFSWIWQEMQKQLKKAKDPKVISELKNHISWIVSVHLFKRNYYTVHLILIMVFYMVSGYIEAFLSTFWHRITYQENQLKFESAKHADAGILAEHKKKEREAAKQGKRPFYLKQCNVMNLSLPLAMSFFLFCSFGIWQGS